MNTPLKIKLEGNAEMNQIIKDTLKVFLPALQPFKNKKVCKVDGTPMKSLDTLKTLMPKHKRNDGTQFSIARIDFSRTSMKIVFKFSKSGGSYDTTPNTAYTEWFERTIYIGEISNQSLTKIHTLEQTLLDYNLNDEPVNLTKELEKIEQYKKLKHELDTLYSSIDRTISSHYYLSR